MESVYCARCDRVCAGEGDKVDTLLRSCVVPHCRVGLSLVSKARVLLVEADRLLADELVSRRDEARRTIATALGLLEAAELDQ